MYVNLSGKTLSVYDATKTTTLVGTVLNNCTYVIRSSASGYYTVNFKASNSTSENLSTGVIKVSDVTNAGKTPITDVSYTTETIDGTSYYIFKVRQNSSLYNAKAEYVGTVKKDMFVATKDTLCGNSYPYLKHIYYVMTSSTNDWEKLEGTGGFVDSGIRTGNSDQTMGIYGLWGNNTFTPLPEKKETINGLFINAGAQMNIYNVNNSIIGTIPQNNMYAIKEKYESGKCLVHCNNAGNRGFLEGYIKNYTSNQAKSVLDYAFKTEVINGKSYYIFQMLRQVQVYDSNGNNWGKVGTYMSVACSDNKCGRANSNFKTINYIQKSSNLSWVKIQPENATSENDFGFVETGLKNSSKPDEIYFYGNWGNNSYLNPQNLGFVPYTVDHIPDDGSGKRTGISMTPEYITIHSTGNAASYAWGERNYLTLAENKAVVAFHVVVDEREAVEVFPLNEVAYHCGSVIGNGISVGLEICESGNRNKSLDNAAEIAAKLLKKFNLGIDKLRMHNDWSGKNCPRILIDESLRSLPIHTWDWFRNQVALKLGESLPLMYKNEIVTSKSRYSYNVNYAVNNAPNYFADNATYAVRQQTIYYNLNNFKYNIYHQLTSRQKKAFDEVIDILVRLDDSDMSKAHEFRFEGAGTYRAGNSENDSFNSNKTSLVSIDFSKLNGAHYDNIENQEYADGVGLYGALTFVYRKGDLLGLFFRSSTLPDQMEIDDTVAEGKYIYKVGTHPMAGGYKALNLYTIGMSRTLPTIIDNVSGNGASGINAHKGYNSERGSEGCQTIPGADYDKYIKLYRSDDSGFFYIKRYVNLPKL